MSTTVKIKTPQKAAADEALRVKILTPPVTEIDRTGYEKGLAIFKQVCLQVRQLISNPTFRGGFDEWAALALDPQYYGNTQLDILSKQSQALNELITYEAKKLGIVPPQWWKECWADELDDASSVADSSDSESTQCD